MHLSYHPTRVVSRWGGKNALHCNGDVWETDLGNFENDWSFYTSANE